MHERLQLNNLSFMFTEENVSSAKLATAVQGFSRSLLAYSSQTSPPASHYDVLVSICLIPRYKSIL